MHPESLIEVDQRELTPDLLRSALLDRGSVLVRGLADRGILGRIDALIDDAYARQAACDPDSLETGRRNPDPVIANYWQQLATGKIGDDAFRELCGTDLSYYGAIWSERLRQTLDGAFPGYRFKPSIYTHYRRVQPPDAWQLWWDKPIVWHVDAQHHRDDVLELNFWTPLIRCGHGTRRPGLQVILSSVPDLLAYTSYCEAGHADAAITPGQHFHKFIQERFAEEALAAHFPQECFAAPCLEVGDVLILTNFTLHGTYWLSEMDLPRASLEIRLDAEKRPF